MIRIGIVDSPFFEPDEMVVTILADLLKPTRPVEQHHYDKEVNMYKNLLIFLENSYPSGSLLASVQQFLEDKEPDLSEPSLIHLYRSLFQHGQRMDNVLLSEITPRSLVAYVRDLQIDYSPGTVRPIVGDMKQFYRWAHDEGLTKSNLGRRLKKPRPVKIKHHAEEDDMLTLIKSLAKKLEGLIYPDFFGNLDAVEEGWNYESYKTLHDLAAVAFMYETGCRAGELCNLSSRHLLKVLQKPRNTYHITCYGKTNDSNYQFTNTTAELCGLWFRKRPFKSRLAFNSWKRGHGPGNLTTNGLSQMLARRCRQAGVEKPFRSHAIRHSKVIRSRKIAGLEIASKLIDHASIQTTRAYDYIDDDELAEAAEKTGLRIDLW